MRLLNIKSHVHYRDRRELTIQIDNIAYMLELCDNQ